MLSPDRIVETDGLGSPVCRRVCAWCQDDLGVVACLPHQVHDVSHGICPACQKRLLDELPGAPSPGGVLVVKREPVFSCVQGSDFGRAIAWARRQPNVVGDAIRRHLGGAS